MAIHQYSSWDQNLGGLYSNLGGLYSYIIDEGDTSTKKKPFLRYRVFKIGNHDF